MIRLYLAGGVAALVISLGGLCYWQGQEIRSRNAEIDTLRADLKAAEKTAKIEYRTQTIIREIHTKASEAQANVIYTPDPECANAGPMLDAWRAGINSLRTEATDNPVASVEP